jgi:hypothetical protein
VFANLGKGEAFSRKTSPQQLANSGGPARHSFKKPPIVKRRQFLRLQHDLHAYDSIGHGHGILHQTLT